MNGFNSTEDGFSLVAIQALQAQAEDMYTTPIFVPDQIYYVTQSGSGSGDGSTYANAMSLANHNAGSFLPKTLIYLSGDFTSTITVPSNGDATGHIVYDGDDGVNPPMTRTMTYNGVGQTGVQGVDSKYITLQNLTMVNGATGISFKSGDYDDETDLVRITDINIYKCNLQQMIGSGIAIFGGNLVYDKVENIVVGGSPANANMLWNIGVGTGSQDLSVVCCTNVLVSHNTMGADIGTGASTDRGIDGIVAFRCHDMIIEHNQLGPHWDMYTPDPTGGGEDHFIGTGEDGIDLKDINYDIVIRYNTFPKNRQSGLTVQSGTYNVEVYGNYFTENVWGGLWTIKSGESGTQPPEGWGTVRNLDVHHNIFYRNYGYGMLYNAGFDVFPPEAEFDTEIEVWNNVFVENGIEGPEAESNDFVCGLGFYQGANNIAKNNIYMNNRSNYAAYHQFVDRHLSVMQDGEQDYNNYFDSRGTSQIYMNGVKGAWNTAGTTIHDVNSMDENPQFVNDVNDFQLQAGSPSIGTGIVSAYTTDYDGNMIYPPYDIGAYNQGTE